jgi:hypothetical protein
MTKRPPISYFEIHKFISKLGHSYSDSVLTKEQSYNDNAIPDSPAVGAAVRLFLGQLRAELQNG